MNPPLYDFETPNFRRLCEIVFLRTLDQDGESHWIYFGDISDLGPSPDDIPESDLSEWRAVWDQWGESVCFGVAYFAESMKEN